MRRAWLIALAGSLIATSAAAGLAELRFNRIGDGRGPLRWASDCTKPNWSTYDRFAERAGVPAAEYRSYFSCLSRAASEDKAFAVQAIDDAAREEHDQVVREGRAAGYIR